MRIISLSPSVTETLVLLGLEDVIVGITPWCRMYLKDPDNKIIVGSYLTILWDRIELLKPDIIFLQSRVQDKLFWILKEKGF
ncbi:MAG: ABC transporter substrate-binding protein [Desulfurococcaceae archaeon]|nr:ABC transporter substrate-binding protein [Desulfurococcaceae archaeon]